MRRRILVAGCRILGDDSGKRRDILIEGRRILRIGAGLARAGVDTIPARGLVAAPGLIDTQINGGWGLSFGETSPEETIGIGRKLLSFGVTSYLPTLVSLPRRDTLAALTRLAVAASHSEQGARILGVHLEGPFLNPRRRGAHRARNLRRPSVAELREYVRAAGGWLRMMTVASELPGARGVIREGARRGIVMCAGHSEAVALGEGVRHVTHVFNAMAPLHHRENTILAAALLADEVSCGLIYDGRHVGVHAARLLLGLKPPGKVVLVSDAAAACGAPDGEYAPLGEERVVVRRGEVRVKGSGRLAGGSASLLECVKGISKDAAIPMACAWDMASAAPARLLGFRRKGVLRAGADADIVLLDTRWNVEAAFVEGSLRSKQGGRTP